MRARLCVVWHGRSRMVNSADGSTFLRNVVILAMRLVKRHEEGIRDQ